MKPIAWVGIIVIIIVVVGGYFAYEEIKYRPPAWVFAIMDAFKGETPPLPPGDIAPLQAPEGFTATIYARDITNPRVLTRDPRGVLVASITSEGAVLALPDEDGDGKADSSVPILTGLDRPHGIVFICSATDCSLYVAETKKLTRYAYDPATRIASAPEKLMDFPDDGGHFTRTLLPHPDGKRLLISIGSSCNVCKESNPIRAGITALDLSTDAVTSFATGLRNSVFMAISPVTGAIWATENGRDVIGNDIPPDELNILQEGKNYGWPVCYGKNIYDDDFDAADATACTGTTHTPSTFDLQAHSAALGLAFIPEEGWPEDMRNDLLVAFHGSWNRDVPTGYKVVRFDMSPDGKTIVGGPYDFLTGFLAPGADEGDAIGRPVGLLAEPGGVVYVSDDTAGAIYKVANAVAE